MDRLLAIFILLLSPNVWAFDHDVVKGQWGIYQQNTNSKIFYYFLNINNDFSGTFVRALGHKPITHTFNTEDVIKRDGYLEVQLDNDEKAVLSAWKLESGSGRLTGQIFMYKENGELFNMLHFPLQLIDSNHEFMKHNEIRQLSEIYR